MIKEKKYIKENRDGLRVCYLLRKKGIRLVDVAQAVGKTNQSVHEVVHGKGNSQGILDYVASLGIPRTALGASKR